MKEQKSKHAPYSAHPHSDQTFIGILRLSPGFWNHTGVERACLLTLSFLSLSTTGMASAECMDEDKSALSVQAVLIKEAIYVPNQAQAHGGHAQVRLQ